MSMNKTPSANRVHIAVFGKRNSGKSTLINAISNQNLSIVSDFAGTTTDPVYKAMEILPIGPVVLIDTAGIDDEGELGELRIKKTQEVMRKCDLAIVVITPNNLCEFDKGIIKMLKEKNIDFIFAINKIDILEINDEFLEMVKEYNKPIVKISAEKKIGIAELKTEIIKNSPKTFEQPSITGEIISPGETAVLVIPIDTGMPKGRLILPQVQTIRDLLDNDAIAHVVKERELRWTLANFKTKPKIVITDSQAFMKVSADTPDDILLTSFSILFAKYKGDLLELVRGAKALRDLKPGDKVLIAEACTHHQQPDDIGTVKIPRWIRQHIEPNIEFAFSNGRDYPENIDDYKVVIHCAGCMLNRKEMLTRIGDAVSCNVPIVNYGVTIAFIHGILDRALKPFPEVYSEWMQDGGNE